MVNLAKVTREGKLAQCSSKGLIWVGLSLGILLGQTPPGLGNSAEIVQSSSKLKIVLHVSAVEGWLPAFSNVKHLKAQYPQAEIRIVVDGTGVLIFLGDNDFAQTLAQLTDPTIKFQACHNAMEEKQVPFSSLPRVVELVPSGVVAITELQRAGFAYIKP